MSHENLPLERVREQFTRQADAYARMQQACDEVAFRKLVDFADATPAQTVLDVACGPGFLTMVFAAHCATVTGFDATDRFLMLARAESERRGLHNVCFDSGDAELLPYADHQFDLTVCRAAFHHLRDPARVLAQMKRVTKPQGHLLILDMVTSPDVQKADYHNRIERLCDPSHVRALSETEFDALYHAAGLVLEKRFASEIRYANLAQWLDHGSPPEQATREIYALMEASLVTDLCGLQVRKEAGELCFSHSILADLVSVPAAID